MARGLLPLLLALLLVACGGTKAVVDSTPAPAQGGDELLKNKRAQVMRMYMDATSARLQGEYGKAVQLYRGVLKLDPNNAATMFELAKLYHQDMQGVEALALAKKAVAADPDNIWYRFMVAELSSQLGDMQSAAKAYQGILDKWPDRYEVYFGLADALARQGKVDEAQKVYRTLEKQFGLNEELVAHEYEMLMMAGEDAKARALLEHAIEQEPGNAEYLGMLADLYYATGDKEKALEYYEKVLAAEPDDSMVRISLAQYYYDEGMYTEGFGQLKEAFADPDLDIDPKMQLLLGFYQLSGNGQPDSLRETLVEQSHALIQVMKKAHPQSGKPSSIEGDFFMREGKTAEARDAFREALVHEKDKFPIWGALLQLDFQLSDWEALDTDAAKASEFFPTQPELYLYQGLGLSQQKKHAEAIDALLMGRDLVVDNPSLEAQFLGLMGDAYNELKEYRKSDEAYAKALAINKEDTGVMNNWAYFLSERGEQLDKAEEMSRRCNELSPGSSTFMDTYAWILFKQGKYAEARQWQEKALKATPAPDGVLLEHYGDILYKLDDKVGALEQWNKARSAGGASDLIDRKISEGKLVE